MNKYDKLADYFATKHKKENGEVLVIGIKSISPSIWSLLWELMLLFIEMYIKDARFVFRVWHIHKHTQMIRKVWQFFERLYDVLLNKDDEDDS